MKYGAMDGVLRQPRDDVFAFAKKLGLDGLELGLGRNYLEDTLWHAEPRQLIKQKASQAGVEIPSICLGLFNDVTCNPASPQPDESQTGRDILAHAIEMAVDVGASVLLVPFFGSATIEDADTAGIERMIQAMAVCAPVAAEAGVSLALESKLNAATLIHILDAVDSDGLGVYYDVANAVWCGNDPAEEIRRLGSRIVQMHAKDIEAGPGDRMLGAGRVDFDACVSALADIDYDGYVVLETPVQDDVFADTKANLDYVRGRIGR